MRLYRWSALFFQAVTAIALVLLVIFQAIQKAETHELVVQQELQADAVDFCMQWGVSSAVVIHGEFYCILEVQLQFPTMWLTVPRTYDQAQMEELTGLKAKLENP